MLFNKSLFRSKRTKPLKLYWFKPKNSILRNFGDELSYEIVKKLSGREVEWADKNDCEIVAIGSVLQAILSSKSTKNVAIWGTGLMFDDQATYDLSNRDIRMVRGKLTADKLGLASSVCGDPGLLVDMLYKPSNNFRKVGIVPHYVDKNNSILEKLKKNRDLKIVDVHGSPAKVVSEIASCKLVVSSSLHGIIVAHSFGIPAYWVELSDQVAGNGFKFRDYYSVLESQPLKLSVEKFNNIINIADDLINDYQHYPQLDRIKKNIIHTFPKNI